MTFPGDVSDPVERLREAIRAARWRDALAEYAALGAHGHRSADADLLAATAATRLGEYASARALARGAHERFRRQADGDGRTRAANLLGVIAWEQGELDDARAHYAEALQLAQVAGDALLWARASNNLGLVAHLQGDAAGATGRWREALLAYQKLGDRRGTAETWHNIGIARRWEAAWADADHATTEAVRHAELVGDPALLALVLGGRAELHLERGERALARRELARAAELAREAEDEVEQAEIERLLAVAALQDGQPGEAEQLARRSHAVAEQTGVALLGAESAALVALARRAQGDEAGATGWRESAVTAFRRLGAVAFERRFLEMYAA